MKNLRNFSSFAIGVVLLAVLAIGLSILLQPMGLSPSTTAASTHQPSGEGSVNTQVGPTQTAEEGEPYPPPLQTLAPTTLVSPTSPPSPPPSTPTGTTAPYPETPPLPAGQAATLHNGDIWLVEPGTQPAKLTDFGDVSLIFDWNRDGTQLLFGRGRTEQAWGYTTELWRLDTITDQSRQMTTSGLVKSSSWSPVDDQLAYCEYDNALTIIDLNGKVLLKREQALCMFTWSPDGTAIALETYTPDMLDSDGLAHTVLGIWWLLDDRLQVFSDAKDEVHASPVWSTDGRRILFDRLIYNYSQAEVSEQGLYVADVQSGHTQLVIASPSKAISGIMRSPQADLVVYSVGNDSYVTDFEGNSSVISQKQPSFRPIWPIWLLDGRTLLSRTQGGDFQIITTDATATGSVIGGWLPALSQLEYFIRPGGTR